MTKEEANYKIVDMANAETKESQRLFPTQEVNFHLYQGDPASYSLDLLRFCQQGLSPLPQLAELTPKFALEDMATSPLQVGFLRLLLRAGGCKRALEIGTFVGRTTLAIAAELPENGKVVTIEKGEEFAAIARRNFLTDPRGSKVESLCGDAFNILLEFHGKRRFDFVYLDGAKQLYPQMFALIEPLVESGGLLVADDIFFHGDAVNSQPQTDKGEGAKLFVKQITENPQWRTSILPLGNGLLLGYRE